MNSLGLFVKYPAPGEVKTRLAADVGDKAAARFYRAFVVDLVHRFRRVGDVRYLCYWPQTPEAVSFFQDLAGDDYELWPQPPHSLGRRMDAYFRQRLGEPEDRAVVIGSDSPTLPVEFVEQAFGLLKSHDCVLGPATDGGYYLVGQQGSSRPIFDDVDWSTERVLAQTIDRIAACGARLAVLPPWYDVDSAADLEFLRGHVAAQRLAGQPVNLEMTSGLLRWDTTGNSGSL